MDVPGHYCMLTRMRIPRLAAPLAIAGLVIGLTACAQPQPSSSPTPTPSHTEASHSASASPSTPPTPTTSPVIPPVTQSVTDLQGKTVDLKVGQVLNINTGSLDVTSYTGKVADESIAKFVAGRKDATATFNPGVTALKDGKTTVVLSNKQSGIEDVTFTVVVAR